MSIVINYLPNKPTLYARKIEMFHTAADSDSNPCSSMFMGDAPETELEVLNVIQFLLPLAPQFIAYLTYHSYGQRIFTRWDYTGAHHPPDHELSVSMLYSAVYTPIHMFCGMS